MNVADTLCYRFASALADHEHFSPAAMAKARLCLLDFLTTAFASQDFSWVRQARQVALANSATEKGGAPIIGTSVRVAIADAAFANAVAGHSLVRDDMHLGSVSHLGVVVIPTALALAEQYPVTEHGLLQAIICGYEAGCRLGNLLMDVETAKTFRPTGLIGAFAAAATGARLAGLDVDATGNALGFAANSITGLNEWAAWGSDDMYFHPGLAARNGITVMQLAREGAIAAGGALDGRAGLFAALGKPVPEYPPLPFADGEEILKVFFKQVPACNYAQTAAQAARRLREESTLDPAAITDVLVQVPYAAAHYPGCDYAGPFGSILQARMSIHFNVASALLHGDFDDSHYRDFASADILALASRVQLAVDDDLTAQYPASQGAAVSVTTSGGQTFKAALDDVIAAPAAEVEGRFRAAVEPVLGKASTSRLLSVINTRSQRQDCEWLLDQLSV